MFYVEDFINGKLMCKTRPDGEWREVGKDRHDRGVEDMKIIDPSKNMIAACCQFEFRGFTVSASTIFNQNSVAIWRNPDNGQADEYFDNVEEAIFWILKNA